MNSQSFLLILLKLAAVAAALTVRSASGSSHGHEAEPAAAEESVEGETGKAIHGVSLGDYRIRSYYQVDAQKSTVRFSLFATVKDEHFREVRGLVEEHRQKLRRPGDHGYATGSARCIPRSRSRDVSPTSPRALRRALPEITIEDLYVSEFDLSIKSL